MGHTSSTLNNNPSTNSPPPPLCKTCHTLLTNLSSPSPPITLPLPPTLAPFTPSHAAAGALVLAAFGTGGQILRRTTCAIYRPFLSLVDILPAKRRTWSSVPTPSASRGLYMRMPLRSTRSSSAGKRG
ncbi:hypothetical protein B0T25DRAFT_572106 [Lasiosphaeria hispida]|uniref:Uncharacterized protein n=1 Tax=Lasiosphaeria hispida TaxID=260671 RepID=A0AAJ0HCD6_9PEZI|nr:hypothetical protein B0T25DRAFT_572106 [Lasiosphaeria hispida]